MARAPASPVAPAAVESLPGPDDVTFARARRRPVLWGGLAVLGLLLAVAVLAGLAIGARSIPLGTVLASLLQPGTGSADEVAVRELRVPRTVLALVVGAALGLAGTVLQGITRNPLADPGLLGITAGASLGVLVGITWAGATGSAWFAFAGAAIAGIVVYGVGSLGGDAAASVRLVLVGAAVTAAVTSLVALVLLTDLDTLDRYRFWVLGSLSGRELGPLAALAPFLAVGAVVALWLGPALNAVSLGDDVARGIGQHLGTARAAAFLAVVALSGCATALAGPIAFVGLVVPHVARCITGPDYRWMLRYALLLGPIVLLLADVIGRVVVRPGELEAGVVVAFLGAPVLIAAVCRARVTRL